jgi:acyl-ACP thioesterase
MNDKITVGTLPHRIKGIQGDRNFLMMDENDNVIINANSIWSYFDFINNRPIRVTKDQIEAYKLEPAYPMEYAERRIKIKDIPEDLYETKAEITVTESMIDVIGHMNNMQYVLVSNDYLPEGYRYNQVRVEYLMPALKWDKIVVKQYRDDERLICLLVSPDGDKYAIIEYTNVNIK